MATTTLRNVSETGTLRVKTGLAEMLKGGVIMDVVDAEQAKIAEDAGACAVMALERVPADIRADGGVARMADPDKIREIQEAVTIPVMAKCRIGHFVEAQILESLEVDYVDESEVLTPADVEHHVDKWQFTIPFVCGCTNLGEALRRIAEGAAMIRTKGEAGTGDIVNAVTHMRAVFGTIRRLQGLPAEELYAEAKELRAPYELVRWVAENGRLPVVTFTAGGIATPADAALCMQLGADGVFVGSGIFKSGDPDLRAKAIVEATTHFRDADVLARVSAGLGEADGRHLRRGPAPRRAARNPRLVRGGGTHWFPHGPPPSRSRADLRSALSGRARQQPRRLRLRLAKIRNCIRGRTARALRRSRPPSTRTRLPWRDVPRCGRVQCRSRAVGSRGRTFVSIRNAWSPPSQATFTNPISVPSPFRAVTQPRLCGRIRFHHPACALPPWDCVRVTSSSSVASPRHAKSASSSVRRGSSTSRRL